MSQFSTTVAPRIMKVAPPQSKQWPARRPAPSPSFLRREGANAAAGADRVPRTSEPEPAWRWSPGSHASVPARQPAPARMAHAVFSRQ